MKILFVSPDIEQKPRGINVILKSLMIVAKQEGHEVGLLTGIPSGDVFDEEDQLRSKIEHLWLQHYLRKGRESFQYIIKGGYRKKNLLKSLLNLSVFRSYTININRGYLSGDERLLRHVDFAVRSPFYYQFLVRNISFIPRHMLKKVVKKNDIDLVIVASPSLLRSKDAGSAKLAHFVHDVMPLELVEAPPDENTPNKYAAQFYSTVMKSDFLLTNSEDTKKKVSDVNSEASVHVLYGTASSKKKDITNTSILKNKNLNSRQYLVFVSTLEKRKNLENLMDAYALIAEKIKMPLVLVGGAGYGFEDILEKYDSLPEHIRKQIVFTGYVSESDKYTLLNNAFSFVFPSVYEGIGLIIIEAMQHNIPVITTKNSGLIEAAGDAAHYINDPYDIAEIAERIMEVHNDGKLRDSLREKGSKVSNKFSHEHFRNRFKKALEKM